MLALIRTVFSLYDNCMNERETINGVPVTEEQIAAWAAEAEAGYDVAALKKRGRGRPGRVLSLLRWSHSGLPLKRSQ